MAKNVEYIISLNDKFSKKIKGANTEAKAFGGTTKALSSTLAKLTPAMIAVGGVALFKKTIETGMAFEKQMSEVKALSGATSEEFKALRQQAEKLGATTQFSAQQAAEGLSFLSMAGFSVENSLKALPGTLDLAAAGSLDLGKAADIASNVLTQFGIQAENLGRVNDVIAKTATSSNTSVEQMAEGLKFTGTTAKVVGQSLEETSAAIGLLANAGLQGSIGGTSLNFALLEMANQASPTAKKLKKLGIELRDNQGKFVGITSVIQQFEKQGLKAEKALEVFGARGGRAFGALLQAGSKQLSDFTDGLKNSEGAAKRMAKIKLDNLAGDMTLLKSASQGLAISFSRRLNPAMRKSTQGAAKFVQKLDKLIKLKPSEEIRREKFEFNALINTLQNANTHEKTRLNVIEKLNTKYKPYLNSLVTEKTTQDELNDLRKKGNEEFLKTIRLQARRELIAEEEAKVAETIQKIIELEMRLGSLQEKLKVSGRTGQVTVVGVMQSEAASTEESIRILQSRLKKLNAEATKGADKVQRLLSKEVPAIAGDAVGTGSLAVKTKLDKAGRDLQKETKITSRSPKVVNINIQKLIETQEINTETLTESAPQIKKLITETILDALNDSQLALQTS